MPLELFHTLPTLTFETTFSSWLGELQKGAFLIAVLLSCRLSISKCISAGITAAPVPQSTICTSSPQQSISSRRADMSCQATSTQSGPKAEPQEMPSGMESEMQLMEAILSIPQISKATVRPLQSQSSKAVNIQVSIRTSLLCMNPATERQIDARSSVQHNLWLTSC